MERINWIKRVVIVFVIAQGILHCSGSFATLGESADSVENERIAFSATRREPETQNLFVVNKIASKNTVIKEYASYDGVVFAVSWTSSRSHPDLTSILGSYLSDYQSALQKVTRSRLMRGRSGIVRGTKVVVEKSGHMRALMNGRAYAPGLIPAGVNLNEVQ